MKKLVNLKGVKTLNKNEQKKIEGGYYDDGYYPTCQCRRVNLVIINGVLQFRINTYEIPIGGSCAAGYINMCQY